MNRTLVDQIARAVLYEGYILYPYRLSIKNRQRWTFGGLYPESYCKTQANGDASSMQTECLVVGTARTRVEVNVHFLHLLFRQIAAVEGPVPVGGEVEQSALTMVESLEVEGKLWQTWQEAVEREVDVGDCILGDLVARPCVQEFALAGKHQREPVHDATLAVRALILRDQQDVTGTIHVAAKDLGKGTFRITVRIDNRTPLDHAELASRDEVLLRAFVSTHTVLGVQDGEFVSLLDPPESLRNDAAECRNIGAWPVLVGAEDERDTMLSSPIILYDYPQVAPESAGDFFDGTEIDEMLTLRIMTLTDEEKRAMSSIDERARALLERTETTARDQLKRLHGTMRV